MSSALRESAVKRGPGRRRKVERGRETQYGEVESNVITKAECRDLDTGKSSARRAERSSDSGSLGGVRACENHSSEQVLKAAIEVKGPTTWQKYVTGKWSKYTRADFPQYAVAHRRSVEKRAEECVTMGSVKLSCRHRGDNTTASCTKDAEAQSFW